MIVKINGKEIYKLTENLYVDDGGIRQFKNGKFLNTQNQKWEKDFIRELKQKEINLCMLFLKSIKEGSTYTDNSYSGKHKAEKFHNRYVSNGNFIVALIMCGWKIRLLEFVGFMTTKSINLKDTKKVIPYLSLNVEYKLNRNSYKNAMKEIGVII